jgi:hypothetical protein
VLARGVVKFSGWGERVIGDWWSVIGEKAPQPHPLPTTVNRLADSIAGARERLANAQLLDQAQGAVRNARSAGAPA